jgi:acetoin utilization deacetylase AcuC-like enzyme
MRLYYSDHYSIKLPLGHRFPMNKYAQLREQLLRQGIVEPQNLFPTRPIDMHLVRLAHCPQYLEQLMNLSLSPLQAKRLGFPLSADLLLRSRASAYGVYAAAKSALIDGFSGNLSGGTHHAHYDYGGGFCVLNDFAITTRALMYEKLVQKVLILDLDVHQGDGNSSILGNDPNVTIVSLHGAKNYPHQKIASTIDRELPDGIEDDQYLDILNEVLKQLSTDYDLCLYQAGVDTLQSDRLGRTNLTKRGLKRRDGLVFHWAKAHSIPIALALGGGYADPIEDTVNAHLQSFQIAKEIYFT